MAYERIAGPLGGRRGDVHTALILQAIAGLAGSKQDLADFIPTWDDDLAQAAQSPEEQLAIVEDLNRLMGGVDLRGHHRDPDGPPRR